MRAIPDRRLDKRVIQAWRLEQTITAVVLLVSAGVLVAILYSLDVMELAPLLMMLVIFAILLIIFIFVWPSFRYARWRFDVTKDEVDLMEGILIRKRTIIPLVRVQSVNTSQGPILRMLSISEVSISTAAGTHAIPALSNEEAATLRDHISALAQVAQEDV